jgi:hypothetical protein
MYGCARRVWEQITIETKINIKLKRGFIVAPSTVLIFLLPALTKRLFNFHKKINHLSILEHCVAQISLALDNLLAFKQMKQEKL